MAGVKDKISPSQKIQKKSNLSLAFLGRIRYLKVM
jgi:hypothetical protein